MLTVYFLFFLLVSTLQKRSWSTDWRMRFGVWGPAFPACSTLCPIWMNANAECVVCCSPEAWCGWMFLWMSKIHNHRAAARRGSTGAGLKQQSPHVFSHSHYAAQVNGSEIRSYSNAQPLIVKRSVRQIRTVVLFFKRRTIRTYKTKIQT